MENVAKFWNRIFCGELGSYPNSSTGTIQVRFGSESERYGDKFGESAVKNKEVFNKIQKPKNI